MDDSKHGHKFLFRLQIGLETAFAQKRKLGWWEAGYVARGEERGSRIILSTSKLGLARAASPSLPPYLPPSPSRPPCLRRAGGRVEWRRALVCKDTLALRPLARRRTGKPRRWTKLLSDNLGRFSLGNSELALPRQRQCSGALSSPAA